MTSCVVIFGREPVAGRVKTRLAAGVGDEAAARVYAVLLDHVLEIAADSGARIVLSLAETPSPLWAARLGVPFEIQRSGDLGERMADAFARRFAEGEDRVVVVGSDCPGMATRHLRNAAEKLEQAEVILGPATDGGYYLVAQRPPGVDLFSNIPWSSPETVVATRNRLRELGVARAELEELSDVDTETDLKALLADPHPPATLIDRLRAALAANP
ncbi:MAG: TIGR04282 family arsenosugar biosynthesis glycosyltransferase [Thermoanaerobaculales bacterium]